MGRAPPRLTTAGSRPRSRQRLRVEYPASIPHRVRELRRRRGAAGLGGAFAALAVGHVDPETVYWTTSGEFVFIAVLGGTGNVMAPFLGAAIFEAVRTIGNQYAPNVWQMTLGVVMLLLILFLPSGLWSLVAKRVRT
jgi:branched-chain amino acid transport system permease protein